MSHIDHPTESEIQAPINQPTTGTITAGAAALAATALSACGGGGDDASTVSSGNEGRISTASLLSTPQQWNKLTAFRFLTQATFGPIPEEVTTLASAIGSGTVNSALGAWIDQQLSLKLSVNHRDNTSLNYHQKIKYYFGENEGAINPEVVSTEKQETWFLRDYHVTSAWWKNALTAQDQLRLRVAFALSEILPISMAGTLRNFPYKCASYYDLLVDGAFGSYKDLVTKVASHPAMGMYLSHLGNRKPDAATGRIPDQNFAREILQLFTIGLNKLNLDGSDQLDGTGKKMPAYSDDDVKTLSHVFTGWGYANNFNGVVRSPLDQIDLQTSLMTALPSEHSLKADYPGGTTNTIRLLGKALAISDNNPVANRKAALDIIFNHPNLSPFIARQMIQRLVTSNPSKTYVFDTAKAFRNANYNIGALVKAILLHPEATQTATLRANLSYGKLKEPILRVTQFLRAYKVSSVNDLYVFISDFESNKAGLLQSQLGQGALEPPSVFNFFRPGYVSPGGKMAAQGKVTPEMQLCGESDIAKYAEVMQRIALEGYGCSVSSDGYPRNPAADASARFRFSVKPDLSQVLTMLQSAATLAEGVTAVVDDITAKLFGGTISKGLRDHLIKALSSRVSTLSTDQGALVPNYTGNYQTDVLFARRALATALFVATLSPEYVVQR